MYIIYVSDSNSLTLHAANSNKRQEQLFEGQYGEVNGPLNDLVTVVCIDNF